MIKREPRAGYGYGIIRLSWQLAEHIAPFVQIKAADTQGCLEDQGILAQIKQSLLLPDDYTIHGVYFEPMRRTWCILVEAPGIPIPSEGEILPVLTPIYQHCYDFEKWQGDGDKPPDSVTLLRVDIAPDPFIVLRVADGEQLI
jgi:hypothetical protein